MQALAAGPKAGKPPFRETKLTRLLSGAFGGRANTALCVCVGPSKNDAFETLNSLQFGQQAMSVKVLAKANATVDDLHGVEIIGGGVRMPAVLLCCKCATSRPGVATRMSSFDA